MFAENAKFSRIDFPFSLETLHQIHLQDYFNFFSYLSIMGPMHVVYTRLNLTKYLKYNMYSSIFIVMFANFKTN